MRPHLSTRTHPQPRFHRGCLHRPRQAPPDTTDPPPALIESVGRHDREGRERRQVERREGLLCASNVVHLVSVPRKRTG